MIFPFLVALLLSPAPQSTPRSDVIRSVIAMFLYDRQRDSSHVLCAGIPDSWIRDPGGVRIDCFPTYHGTISCTVRSEGKKVRADVSGSFDAAYHRLLVACPLVGPLRSVRVSGEPQLVPENLEVVLRSLPATVEFTYR